MSSQEHDLLRAAVDTAAVEAAVVGMAVLDAEGRLLRVNEALCALLGHDESVLLAGTCFDFSAPDQWTQAVDACHRLLAGEIDRWVMPRRYRHADGHEFDALLTMTHLRDLPEDAGGPRPLFLAQLQNVTDRTAAERRAARAADESHAVAALATRLVALEDLEGIAQETADAVARVVGIDAAVFLAGASDSPVAAGDPMGGLRLSALASPPAPAGESPCGDPSQAAEEASSSDAARAAFEGFAGLLGALRSDQAAAVRSGSGDDAGDDGGDQLACFPMAGPGDVEGLLVLREPAASARPLPELAVAGTMAQVGGIALARARTAWTAQAADQLLGVTVDNVPIGMALYRPDLTLRRRSLVLERILGMRMEPGTPIARVFDPFEPADPDAAGGPADGGAVAEAVASGQPQQRELLLTDRRSGRNLRLRIWAVPLHQRAGQAASPALPDPAVPPLPPGIGLPEDLEVAAPDTSGSGDANGTGGAGLTALALVLQDVTQWRQAEADRDNLLRRLVTAQEEERRRLAGDLHDDAVQALIAGLMDLDLLETRRDREDAPARLKRARDSFDHALKATRALLFDLRPPVLEAQGLAAAVRAQLDKTAERTGAVCTLDWRAEGRFDRVLESIVFRTVQESLNNCAKHAKPDTITVRAWRSGSVLTVNVEDDGTGFHTDTAEARGAQGAFGLRSMAERIELAGGILHVTSSPGGGTVVSCWVPVRRA